MSILSSTNRGILGIQESIEEWLKKKNISGYTIKQTLNSYPYFTIDVINANVILVDYKDSELPDYIIFNDIIGGNFIVSYSEISSMRGFPRKVGKNFDISYSKISILENVPELIDRDFVACGLHFTREDIERKTIVTQYVYC